MEPPSINFYLLMLTCQLPTLFRQYHTYSITYRLNFVKWSRIILEQVEVLEQRKCTIAISTYLWKKNKDRNFYI